MKLSDLKRQIEELDAEFLATDSDEVGYSVQIRFNRLFLDNGPEILRRLLVAEEAIERISAHVGYYGDEWVKNEAIAALKTIRGEEE